MDDQEKNKVMLLGPLLGAPNNALQYDDLKYSSSLETDKFSTTLEALYEDGFLIPAHRGIAILSVRGELFLLQNYGQLQRSDRRTRKFLDALEPAWTELREMLICLDGGGDFGRIEEGRRTWTRRTLRLLREQVQADHVDAFEGIDRSSRDDSQYVLGILEQYDKYLERLVLEASAHPNDVFLDQSASETAVTPWVTKRGEVGYDVGQVCLNGHLVNTRSRTQPHYNESYCSKYGAQTILACPRCGEPIRGFYYDESAEGCTNRTQQD